MLSDAQQKQALQLIEAAFDTIKQSDWDSEVKQRWTSAAGILLHEWKLNKLQLSIRSKLDEQEIDYLKKLGVHL